MNRPNQYNVSLGDRLIVSLGSRLVQLIVINTNDDCILASNETNATGTSYEEAVVLRKRDGKYLIGENAEARFFGEGFGGIRLIR